MPILRARDNSQGRRCLVRPVTSLLTVAALAIGVIAAVVVVQPQQAKAAGGVVTNINQWPTTGAQGGAQVGVTNAVVINNTTVHLQFLAYAKAGETVKFGAQVPMIVADGYPITLNFYSPVGQVATCIIPPGTKDWADVCPEQFAVTSATEGIWTITASSGATAVNQEISADLQVQSNGTAQPGRVFYETLPIIQNDYASSSGIPRFAGTDVSLYVVNPQGYGYHATALGYAGIGSVLSASNAGLVRPGSCIPAHVSSTYQGIGGNDAGVPYYPDAATSCGSFKMFLDNPLTAGLPASAARYNTATNTSYTDWLMQPQPLPPTVQNLRFARQADGSGTIAYDLVNYQGGNVTICVDTAADGTCDRTITQIDPASDGMQVQHMTYNFDGKDGTGKPVPPSQDVEIKLSLTKGAEVHFVMGDVEVLSRGIQITALNGPSPGGDLVYYDDRPFTTTSSSRCSLPTGSGATQYDGTAGTPSTGGVHGWGAETDTGCTRSGANIGNSANGNDGTNGGWGDSRNIDFWTLVPTPASQTFTVPGSPLTIAKSADPVSGTVLRPGDEVTYSVTVTNTGDIDYTTALPASIKDDLSKVLNEATYVDGSGSTSAPGAPAPTVTGTDLNWSGPLAAHGTITLSYKVRVNSAPQLVHTRLENSACIATIGQTDDCAPPITHDIKAIGIKKTVASSDTPTKLGSTLTYTVKITNTGTVAYPADAPAEVTDDLTDVLSHADPTFGDGGVANITGGATMTDATTLAWSGPLAAGDSATVTYQVKVAAVGATLVNVVTGPPESNCNVDGYHASGSAGLAPADNPDCSTRTSTAALVIEKKADKAGPLAPGDTQTYTITVTNSSDVDYTTDSPAVIHDDLSKVLGAGNTLAAVAAAPVATIRGAAAPAPRVSAGQLTWSGALAAKQTVEIRYTVTVAQEASQWPAGSLVNRVAGPTESNCPADGTAPAECTTSTPLRAVTIVKTATSPNSPARPGDVISYTVTITNAGGAPYTSDQPLVVNDDLSKLLDDGQLVAGSLSPVDVKKTDTTLTYSGPLAAGGVLIISYKVKVNPLDTLGDGELRNVVTGPGTPQVPESNCFVGSTDLVCSTDNLVRGLEVQKKASVDTTTPGGKVAYTISVIGKGKAPFTEDDPAVVTDLMAGALDDATLVGNATASGGKVTVDLKAKKLTWAGALESGKTITVSYTLVVKPASGLGDGKLVNTVAAPGSNCVTGKEDGCATTTGVYALKVVKKVNLATALPGGKVIYAITITNIGGLGYTSSHPAIISDDMSNVLKQSSYNKDGAIGAGVLGFSAPTLTWTGPLGVGKSLTLTYSVTVSPHTAGGSMTNPVVAAGSNCQPGSTDRSCQVTTTVVPFTPPSTGGTGLGDPWQSDAAASYFPPITPATRPGLAFTGTEAAGLGIGAVVLLVLGGFLVAVTRRKRTNQ